MILKCLTNILVSIISLIVLNYILFTKLQHFYWLIIPIFFCSLILGEDVTQLIDNM